MKLHKPILAAAFLAATLSAHAVQADPNPIRTVQPDGSVVETLLFGDENFSVITDIHGQTILERDGRGFLVPAMRQGRTLTLNEADLATLRSEQAARRAPSAAPARKLPPMDELGRSTFPTVGKVKSPVVLLEYADRKFSVPDIRETIDELCNGENYTQYGSCGSVRQYFNDCSHGLFQPEFDILGPVTLPENSEYYVGGDKMRYFYKAVEFAMKALDEEVDFSQYDADGDGKIDNVFFYFAGHGQNDTHDPTCVWPHQYDFNYYVPNTVDELWLDGVKMATYAASCELKGNIPEGAQQPWMDGIGTFVHEFGHVLGLPDLYDTAPIFVSTTSPGVWSAMDKGNYNLFATCPPLYSAYEQWVCHWTEFDPIREGEANTAPSISSGDPAKKALSIRVPKSAGSDDYWDEWFFFETRTNEGWDKGLPEEGMLIWRVDYQPKKWSGNTVNTDRKPCWQVIQSGKDQGHWTWPGPDGSHFYVCPDVTASLTPSNKSNGFSVILDKIEFDGDQTTFGYNRITDRPETVTEMNPSPVADQENRDLTISWEPVEGADDYLLTVTLKDEDNWTRYIDYWEQKSTGGARSVTMRNIMEKFWIREVTCFVRVVEGVPSKNTSKPLKFIPANLGSGVEMTEQGATPFLGLKGRISAPAGAEIRDLQGRRRGDSGLEPGLYLVSFQGKTRKVVVR